MDKDNRFSSSSKRPGDLSIGKAGATGQSKYGQYGQGTGGGRPTPQKTEWGQEDSDSYEEEFSRQIP